MRLAGAGSIWRATFCFLLCVLQRLISLEACGSARRQAKQKQKQKQRPLDIARRPKPLVALCSALSGRLLLLFCCAHSGGLHYLVPVDILWLNCCINVRRLPP